MVKAVASTHLPLVYLLLLCKGSQDLLAVLILKTVHHRIL